MTDEEFAAGVDQIIAENPEKSHAAHRALDLLWTRYTQELPSGHPLRTATAKWMAHIEGDHDPKKPYPLPRPSWWQRNIRCLIGRHQWVKTIDPDPEVQDYVDGWGVWSATCSACGAETGSGNPCP